MKLIDDEAKSDPAKYQKWYNDFQVFLKDGMFTDHDNKDALFRLARFNTKSTGAHEMVSCDEYISKMKKD